MTEVSRRGLVAGAGAAGLLGLTGCSSGAGNDEKARGSAGPHAGVAAGVAAGGPVVLADKPSTVGRWTQKVIGPAGLGSDADYVPGVDAKGRLTITSPAGNTGGNNRLIFTPDSTEHTDVEMHCVIEPPVSQSMAAKLPQLGLALRIQDHDDGTSSAFVFDVNIARETYDRLWCALWQWTTSGMEGAPHIDDASAVAHMHERFASIRTALRTDALGQLDAIQVDRVPVGWSTDDRYVIEATDTDYEQSAASAKAIVWGVSNALMRNGPGFAFESPPGATADKDLAVVGGNIRQAAVPGSIPPKGYYPMHVVARAVGAVAQVRTWPVGTPDPGWDSQDQAVTVDFAHPHRHSTPLNVPTKGTVGVLANHLQGGKTATYSDITITDLSTGA